MRERNWKSRTAVLVACLIMASVLASAQNASATDISSSVLVDDCESNAETAFKSNTEESNVSSTIEMVGPVFDESLLSGAGTNDTIMATHTFSVSGRITYEDRDGWFIMPLRRVKVTIWDKDLLFDDRIGGDYYTDKDGYDSTFQHANKCFNKLFNIEDSYIPG